MKIAWAVAVVLISLGFVSKIEAQNERRDSRAIAMIKGLRTSRLDKRLPAIPFSQWLGRAIGKSQKIEWEINDCGEQDGTGRQKDFPICVQAAATIDRVEICIMIAVGTHKRGVTGKPIVWGVWVGKKGEVNNVFDNLSDLVPELNRLKQLGT